MTERAPSAGDITVHSVRDCPERAEEFILYFQAKWASEASAPVYRDCILHTICAETALPQWYLLFCEGRVAGCAGLISNDFISRMDLFPWICALYIEPEFRGRALGAHLLSHARKEAARAGYPKVYLCTDHIGYYEKYGFSYVGTGYHPWGESSRIYVAETRDRGEHA